MGTIRPWILCKLMGMNELIQGERGQVEVVRVEKAIEKQQPEAPQDSTVSQRRREDSVPRKAVVNSIECS